MVTLECPCCDTPAAVGLPLAESVRCEECSVAWNVVDPEAEPAALPCPAPVAA